MTMPTFATDTATTDAGPGSVGALLRTWRARRRFSQLDLAGEAEVSTRHLSFVETGRAQPSREMLLLLAERLDMPLRERNRLLLAGGYAPVHSERPLDRADMTAARLAVEAVLSGHDPFPALAVDRHWQLVAANAAVGRLMAGVTPRLLAPPINVLRLSLDPEGPRAAHPQPAGVAPSPLGPAARRGGQVGGTVRGTSASRASPPRSLAATSSIGKETSVA